MSVVRIENVYKDYLLGDQKVQALKDITLSFEPGVFLAIAGPSGSGKTTLLNLIGCIDSPTSGKIFINDVDVSDKTPDHRITSYNVCYTKLLRNATPGAEGTPLSPSIDYVIKQHIVD